MINTTPITQFIQALKATELAQQREFKIPIQQARLLGLALAEVLDKMNQDYESLFNELKQSSNSEVVTVELDGGDFSDK
jgi:uncharacterized membrane-anchored protein YhcB (DUF1043 family)